MKPERRIVGYRRLVFSYGFVGVVFGDLVICPSVARAAPCTGQDTATVTCANVTTTNDVERTSTNQTATTVGISGTNNGFGIAIVQSGLSGTSLTVTNNGSVAVDAVGSSSSRPVLQLTGNGGLISYSGSGDITNNTALAFSPALTITNVNNGGGGISVNTGTATVSGPGGINLTTAGFGTIDLTTGGQISSLPLGSAITASAVSGITTINVISGLLQSASFGIGATASGTGDIRIDMTGGQINSGLTGIATATRGNIFVTANTIVASNGSGIFASGTGNGTVRVDTNGTINSSAFGVSAGGFGPVTVNIANNITATAGGVDAASDSSTTVTQTAGTIQSGGDGIAAGSITSGGVTVNITGGQIGTNAASPVGGNGVSVQSFGSANADINITAGAIFSTSDGINARFANSDNAGNINITSNGNIFSAQGNGIVAEVSGPAGSISVTNNASISANGAFAGIHLLGGSANSIINTGTILGSTGIQISRGTTTLTNSNTITGGTAILIDNGGTLFVDNTGSINGTVRVATGTLASGSPVSTQTINGNLILSSGASYAVKVAPMTASKFNFIGTATLGGALQVEATGGVYSRGQSYVVLHANNGINGAFSGLTTSGSFGSNLKPQIVYDSNGQDVDILLSQAFVTPALPPGSTGNQHSVATGIDNAIGNGATLVGGFNTLLTYTGSQLTTALDQASGQTAVGIANAGAQLTTSFLTLLLNPFGGASDDSLGAAGAARSFGTSEQALSPEVAAAYAALTPCDARLEPQGPRWKFWGSGFGGYNRTSGDAAAGTANTSVSAYGLAAGADFQTTPGVTVGFALAGGATNWGLAQSLGSGRSDVFQMGVYASKNFGAAYASAALSYAWHDVTTDRTLTIAGTDKLEAKFNAQSFGARIETGYRFATSYIGITPYAALQAQSFWTPPYIENAIAGANTFALTYSSRSVTATRTEIGSWFDKQFAVGGGNELALRTRVAWAHDHFNRTGVNAVFQALPGSNFTVNGASGAPNSALLSQAAELRLSNRISIGAKFIGEFSSGSQTYAGTGTFRYVW
jgi:outer membrane autotransporter protein